MTLEAKPSNTDLNEICYPEGDYLDAPAALDAMATVVDDMVYLGCWDELDAAHKVAKQMFLAQHYSAASTEHADRLSKAGEQFNRMGCEDLRFLLTTLAHYFVDTDEVSSVRPLSSYFLNRKSGGQFRGDGHINLAESHERSAEGQLDRMVQAAGRIEDNR
jgi:hypothetical protein